MRNNLQQNREMRPLLKDGRLHLELSDKLKNSVDIVLRAYKSHRNPEGYAYLSMPVSSGNLLYDVFEKYEVFTLDELLTKGKDIHYNEVIRPNIESNIPVADKIANNTKKTVIAPAVFGAEKQGWPQEAYMFLWFRVLEEIIDETIMTDNWQYDNGDVQEFVRAHEIKFNFALTPRHVVSNLPSYLPRSYWSVFKNEGEAIQYSDTMNIKDENLNTLPLHEGANLIACAIVNLERRGFNPKKLKQSLFEIGGLAECHEWYKDRWLGNYVSMPWNIDYENIYESIRMVQLSFRSCSEKH